jgi:hypothetical protein
LKKIYTYELKKKIKSERKKIVRYTRDFRTATGNRLEHFTFGGCKCKTLLVRGVDFYLKLNTICTIRSVGVLTYFAKSDQSSVNLKQCFPNSSVCELNKNQSVHCSLLDPKQTDGRQISARQGSKGNKVSLTLCLFLSHTHSL